MSRFTLLKCDWCPREERVPQGSDTPTGWRERPGTIPVEKKDLKENKKWFEPTEQTLLFCSDKCNQAHKDVEAECLEASHTAWLRVYNGRKGG